MAGIAQLVEPWIVIPVVAGSNPVSRPTTTTLSRVLILQVFKSSTFLVHLKTWSIFLASIQKLKQIKGTVYKVSIRRKGARTVSKTFKNRKLALQFANRIESDREQLLAYGRVSVNKIMFSELAEDYLRNSYSGKYPNDQRMKLKFWSKCIGNIYISEITTLDISKVLNTLTDRLSNATINRYKAAVSVVFSYACLQYELPHNPVKNIPSKPEDNKRVRYLSNDERKRLFDACRYSPWFKLYLLVLTAITTGARKGELLRLRWSDIDFDRHTAYVSITKNGQPKVLPLTKSVIEEMYKYKLNNNSLIFNSEIKPDKAFCFNKNWKKALEVSEIENFRFHDLRHTTASYLAQSGASLLEIADVLGHKQISVTQRYSHLCIDHKSKLINNIMSGIK